MAASVNRVILVGNVGKDPDDRSLQDGTRIVSFTLATSETWNDRSSGERREKTEWHRIVVMGNDHLTKIAAERVHKGSKVYIEGRLQTRKWEKDGIERYTTEVVVGRFNCRLTLLDARSDDSGPRDDDHAYGSSTPARGPAANAGGTAHRGATARQNTGFGNKDGHLDDDEVPF